jgi:anti-anti-sigma factor
VAGLPNFRIDTARAGSGTTMKLAGELDSASCSELAERFELLARAGDTGEVVLDLADVAFVDSAGMRAIIVIERIARERSIALAIRPPAGPVIDLLQMTGVGDRVPLTPSAGDPPPSAPFIERSEIELARERTAPGRARAELREAALGRVGEAERATLTLMTSEVVTNAVIHPDPDAGGSVFLRITVYSDRVRVEVTDAGTGFDATALQPRPREVGGHGLVVVEGLSSRWGTRRTGDGETKGFCVWFELDVGSEKGARQPGEPAERSVAAAEG